MKGKDYDEDRPQTYGKDRRVLQKVRAGLHEVLMHTLNPLPTFRMHTCTELRLAEVEACRRVCTVFRPIATFTRTFPEHSQLSQGALQDLFLGQGIASSRGQAVGQLFQESAENLYQFNRVLRMRMHHRQT